MAKKYLLYIHDMRFDIEPEKSQLVNDLLASHYGNAGVATIQHPKTHEPINLHSPEGQRIEQSFQFCKHDAVVGLCKKGCR